MSAPLEAAGNRERSPIRFGFRAQAVSLMLGLLLLGVLILSLLIERTIRNSYQEIFAEQFAVKATLIRERIEENSSQNSDRVIDESLNPRVMAALEVGPSDDYERFFYDTIEAFRADIENAAGVSFIALIKLDGSLQLPQRSEIPSVITASDASSTFTQNLLDTFSEELPKENTVTALWNPLDDGEGLYLTTIHPLSNLFGEPMGHIFMGLPYTLETPLSGREALFKINLYPDSTSLSHSSWNEFDLALPQSAPFPQARLSASFTSDEYDTLLRGIRTSLFTFAGIALLMGVFISAAGASSLTKPINTLVKASEKVRLGDFNTRIDTHRKDEWGHLTLAFNDMTEGLEVREKYRDVLNKVADPSVAELLTKGELELGGELRTATVMFCDIRGFTPMTQNMDPQAVIEMVNEHMSALTEIIQAHGGVVDKFVGDEIMALFGVPKEYGDDSLSAVRCAKEMLAKRAWLNDASKGPRIEIGIGISTGPLVAGCMGSADRLSYTVLGATVNLGARLCGKAIAGTCLIDEETHRIIKDDEPTRFFDHISVKGFTAPRPVFTLP